VSLLRAAAVGVPSLPALLLAPPLGVDVDDVTVLREAIDERTEARRVAEHRAPLLVAEVGRDPTIADAVLDRVVRNAHRITMKGPTMRPSIQEKTSKT
jgi:sirohydrochlorin ferrochelatase